jgi:glycosyltransferase involved in cell wall biosynthesis
MRGLMKVVVDARTAHKAFPGIGRYVSGLVHGFKTISEAPSVYLLSAADADGPYELPDFPTIASFATPFSLRQQWAVPRILSTLKPAVYHSPYYLMPYRPGVPTVLTCHDVIPSIFPQYFTRAQRIIYGLAIRLALRTASAVIAVSRQTKADLVSHFKVDPETVTVIAEAPAEGFRKRPPEEIATVLKKYGLPRTYVLYVGTNKPHKNLVRLVEAWASIKDSCHLRGFVLVLAGHWDKRFPGPKKRVEDLGCVDSVLFLGTVAEEDLPALYSAATLFVMPSLYEGFGLPVLEAMACDTPVACSNASSMPEVAGTAALAFDPYNVEDMASTIHGIFSDNGALDRLRTAGLERAQRFTWQQAAELTARVYRGVA